MQRIGSAAANLAHFWKERSGTSNKVFHDAIGDHSCGSVRP
jgi:hypothetical protein